MELGVIRSKTSQAGHRGRTSALKDSKNCQTLAKLICVYMLCDTSVASGMHRRLDDQRR